MFVADASTVLAWFLPGQSTAASTRAFKSARRSPIVVPALWLAETENALLKLMRQQRLDPTGASDIRNELALLSKRIDSSIDQDVVDRIWEVATSHMMTVYDATYVELAWRLKLAIASDDQAIKAAAKALGIPLV